MNVHFLYRKFFSVPPPLPLMSKRNVCCMQIYFPSFLLFPWNPYSFRRDTAIQLYGYTHHKIRGGDLASWRHWIFSFNKLWGVRPFVRQLYSPVATKERKRWEDEEWFFSNWVCSAVLSLPFHLSSTLREKVTSPEEMLLYKAPSSLGLSGKPVMNRKWCFCTFFGHNLNTAHNQGYVLVILGKVAESHHQPPDKEWFLPFKELFQEVQDYGRKERQRERVHKHW